MSRARATAILLALVALACRDRRAAPVVEREKVPPRRVIDPPGTVRPLPPYAISNTGVGPYHLGTSLANVLYELPSGPRMALLDVPGLLKQNVIRAEDDGVLISGAVLGDASVIAVVSAEVARTESGISVGASRATVEPELGEPRDVDVARDPRLLVPARLPAARLVMREDEVVAVVLRAPGRGRGYGRAEPVDAGAAAPAQPRTVGDARDKPGRDKGAPRCPPARPLEDAPGTWRAACFSAAGEILRVDGEELSVRSGADGKERLLAQLRVRGLVFAAPLRANEDRDELVVVSQAVLPAERTWTVALYRLEAGRLVRVAEQAAYKLNADGARWIGVSLDEVELLLEVSSREDAALVGGLLVTRVAERIRDVVALREVDVLRRRGAPPQLELVATPPAPPDDVAPDGGAADAGAE
ncbi:MAG: hypothetical protein R3B48_04930 [Kofleriaceae bacterium]